MLSESWARVTFWFPERVTYGLKTPLAMAVLLGEGRIFKGHTTDRRHQKSWHLQQRIRPPYRWATTRLSMTSCDWASTARRRPARSRARSTSSASSRLRSHSHLSARTRQTAAHGNQSHIINIWRERDTDTKIQATLIVWCQALLAAAAVDYIRLVPTH